MTEKKIRSRRPELNTQLWATMVEEIAVQCDDEPLLVSFFHSCILNHHSLEAALSFYLGMKLGSDTVSGMSLQQVFDEALTADATIIDSVACDLEAYFTRDPACDEYSMPFLFFKGFHALQAHRLSHWLWQQQRYDLALFLQNRISVVFDVDIHPAAILGRGIMIDHATAVVIGETAVIGDNVSLLHGVTLGGTGCEEGGRHPTVADGVLISAGAKLLGSIYIGEGVKIAAGSLVLEDVAPHTTVAGVPARAMGQPVDDQPALNMNQQISEPSGLKK